MMGPSHEGSESRGGRSGRENALRRACKSLRSVLEGGGGNKAD
jgi:hypothetical protein